MNVVTLGAIIALIIALVAEFEARGRNLVGWAVVVLCIALLWGRLF